MATYTQADYKQFADSLLDALMTRGGSHGGGLSGGSNSFSGNNARPSNAGRVDTTMLESLNELNGGFRSSIQQWVKAKREMSAAIPGTALKKAHQELVDGLDEVAKTAGMYAKRMVTDYSNFIKANKGNHSAQQDIYTKMQKYSNSLDELIEISSIANKQQTAEQIKTADKLLKNIDDLANELGAAGIKVQKAYRNNSAAGKPIKLRNPAILKEMADANKEVIDNTREYGNNMRRLYDREEGARTKMIAGIENFVKGLVAGAGKAAVSMINDLESRGQTTQTSNEYGKAVDMGLSVDDYNKFQLANTNASQIMLGGAQAYTDGVKQELVKFGMITGAAAKRLTELSNLQMDTGITPNSGSARAINRMMVRVQRIENVDADTAAARAAEVGNSDAFIFNAIGKSANERQDLLEEQLVTLRKIAVTSGFSAAYSAKQLQENINNRNRGLVDKIKTAVTMPMLLKQIEALTGVVASPEEAEARLRQSQGGSKSLTPEQTKRLNNYNTRVAAGMNRERGRASDDALGYDKKGAMLMVETLSATANWDTSGAGMRDETQANITKDTKGASMAQRDINAEINGVMDAMKGWQAEILKLKEELTGVMRGPAGGILAMLGGLATQVVGNLISFVAYRGLAAMFTSAGPSIFAALASGTSALVSGVASAAAGLASGIGAAVLALAPALLVGLAALVGTGIGMLINKYVLSDGRKDAIGGTTTNALASLGVKSAQDTLKQNDETANNEGRTLPLRAMIARMKRGKAAGKSSAQVLAELEAEGIYTGTATSTTVTPSTPREQLDPKSTTNMTNGTQIDDQGNPVTSVTEDQTKILEEIAKNTAKTVTATTNHTERYKENENAKSNAQKYAQSVRANATQIANQRAAMFEQSTNDAIANASAALTSGLPEPAA